MDAILLPLDVIEPVLMFWPQFFLWLASFVITDYFRESLPEVTASGLGDFQIPTATEGRYVPLVFGTMIVQGPNVVWYGDFRAEERTVTTGLIFKKDEAIGFTYYLGLQMGLIRGQTAGIKRIWIGDDVVWDYVIDNGSVLGSGAITVDRDDIFGGRDEGGGFQGTIRLFDGNSAQAQSAYLLGTGLTSPEPTDRITNLPAYRGYSYVTISNIESTVNTGFGGVFVVTTPAEVSGANIGENNTLRNMKFEIQTFDTVANGGLGDALLLGNDHHFIGEDLNPIVLAYEAFTNTDWGRGLSPSDINLANFQAAAETIWAEGLGFSIIIDQVQKVSKLIDTIEQHIDGYIGPNPITGQLEVNLARQDYTLASEFQADATNIISVNKFARSEGNQTFNELRVQYTDRQKQYKDGYAPAQDLANLIIQGRPRSRTSRYPGVHEADVANKIVWRDLRGMARSLASTTVEINRTAWQLRPGDVFSFTDAEVGVTNMAMRITAIRQGDPVNASLLIDAVEDIFGSEFVGFVDPPASEFIPPTSVATPLAAAAQMAMEAPFIINVNDPVTPLNYPRLFTAIRSGIPLPLSYEVNVDQSVASSPTGFDAEGEITNGVTTVGTIRDTLTPWQDGNGTFTIGVDPLQGPLEELVGTHAPGGVGSLTGVAVINPGTATEEWILISEIVFLTGLTSPETLAVECQGVYRAALDSAMHNHSPGEEIWFIWTGGTGIVPQVFPVSNTLDVKLLPITQTDRVNLTDSPVPPSALPVVIEADERYAKPLLPIGLDFGLTYGNFPITSVSPENFINFDDVRQSANPVSPVQQFVGTRVVPKFRWFRVENTIWQVEGLDQEGAPFDITEILQDQLRLSWWIYDLDATPTPTRGVDEFDSAQDVVVGDPSVFEIQLLKSAVPLLGRTSNTFTARLEIETSHSPNDIITSPETFRTSREIMFFDFEVTAVFVVPPEAVMFQTRFAGDDGAKDVFDVSQYSTGEAAAAIGRAEVDSTQSVFSGTSGSIPNEPTGFLNQGAAGWHFPAPAPLESPSTTFDWNNDWTLEFRMRVDQELLTVDKTIFMHTGINSHFGVDEAANRFVLYYDESLGRFTITYQNSASGQTTFSVNPNVSFLNAGISPLDFVEDQWYAFAIMHRFSGGVDRFSLFVNGVLWDSVAHTTTWQDYSAVDWVVGFGAADAGASDGSVYGWLDEIRFTMGFALYNLDYVLPELKSPVDGQFPSVFDKTSLLASFDPFIAGGKADLSIWNGTWAFGGTSDIEAHNPFNGSPDGVGPRWSLRCDGVDSTSHLIADGGWITEGINNVLERFEFSNRDFTLEVWCKERIATEGDGTALLTKYNRPSGNSIDWWWYINASYNIIFGWSPTGTISSQKSTTAALPAQSPSHLKIPLNEWHHHAVTRKGDDIFMWLDGQLIGYEERFFQHVDADSGNKLKNQLGNTLAIGRYYDVSASSRSRALDGWITEPRITLDEALYDVTASPLPFPLVGSPGTFDLQGNESPQYTYTVPTTPFSDQIGSNLYGRNVREPDPDSTHMEFLSHWIGGAGSPLLTPVDVSANARAITVFAGSSLDVLTPFPNSVQPTGSLRISGITSPRGGATIPDDAVWDYENSDFTLECFVMFNTIPTASPESYATFMGQWNEDSNDRTQRFGYNGATQSLSYQQTTSGATTTLEEASVPWTPVAGPSPEQWYHVSVTRRDSIVYFHIDGVLQGQPIPFRIATTPAVARTWNFGTAFNLSAPVDVLDGWLAETRITIGHIAYNARDYDARTEPFDWHLTIFQPGPDRRVAEYSSAADYSFIGAAVSQAVSDVYYSHENAYFQKPSPDPDEPFRTYRPQTWQSISNGEEMQFAYNAGQALGDSPFTVEAMLLHENQEAQAFVGHYDAGVSKRSWGARWSVGPGRLEFFWSTDGTALNFARFPWAPSPFINVWHHVAFVRDNTVSPERIRCYVDGVELTEGSPVQPAIAGATLFDPTTEPIIIGSFTDNFELWDGRIEELRVIKKVIYSGNFTPPTKRHPRY